MDINEILYEITLFLEHLNPALSEFAEFLFSAISIADLGIVGLGLLIGLIVAVVSAVGSVISGIIVYILESLPVFRIAKKAGRKSALLAWVPVLGSAFRLYALADAPGKKAFRLTEKTTLLKNRMTAFWIRMLFYYFGSAIITALIALLNLIPGLGQILGAISTLLYLLPTVIVAVIEYVFLRDVLDMFREDKSSNRTTAIIVTVIDCIIPLSLARIVILYSLFRKEIINDPEAEEEHLKAEELRRKQEKEAAKRADFSCPPYGNVPPQQGYQYNNPPQQSYQYNNPPQQSYQYNNPPQQSYQYNNPPRQSYQYNNPPQQGYQYNNPPQQGYQYNNPPQHNFPDNGAYQGAYRDTKYPQPQNPYPKNN